MKKQLVITNYQFFSCESVPDEDLWDIHKLYAKGNIVKHVYTFTSQKIKTLPSLASGRFIGTLYVTGTIAKWHRTNKINNIITSV